MCKWDYTNIWNESLVQTFHLYLFVFQIMSAFKEPSFLDNIFFHTIPFHTVNVKSQNYFHLSQNVFFSLKLIYTTVLVLKSLFVGLMLFHICKLSWASGHHFLKLKSTSYPSYFPRFFDSILHNYNINYYPQRQMVTYASIPKVYLCVIYPCVYHNVHSKAEHSYLEDQINMYNNKWMNK